MARGSGRRTAVGSLVVLALVAGAFVWFALHAQGEVVRKADLNDGGVWVTNGASSTFGRLNKPAEQLDAGVALSQDTSGSGIDVLQDGAAVLGLAKASNQLTPIDTQAATLDSSGALTLPAQVTTTGLSYARQLPVALGGGTVAVVDPGTGKLWAQRVDTSSGGDVALDQVQPQNQPVATVGANAVVAVGVDGSVYAASATKGALVTIRYDATSGGFAKPVASPLGFTSKAVELTVVGSRWVAFDPATSRVYAAGLAQPASLSTGDTAQGTLAVAALQQPGGDAASVVVETTAGVEQVALDDGGPSGTVVQLPDSARQSASGGALSVAVTAPVRLGDCVHGAWAGPTTVYYGRACGAAVSDDPEGSGGGGANGEPPQAVRLGGLATSVNGKPVTRADGVALRTNRGLIVLNDLDSGTVWDVDNSPVKVDDWDAVTPPPQEADKNQQKDPNQADDQVVKTPPKAQPDQEKVRAGRTSTLHVLDNDSDATGSILAIAPGDVTQPDAPGVSTSVGADGQTVEVTVPLSVSATSFSFTYTVNNGGGGSTSRASAPVTVQVVDDSVNTPPVLRQGTATLARTTYPVVPGGHVKVGVLADWRDAENDPLSVAAVDDGVGVDASGALLVTGGAKAGTSAVKYHVLDGRGGTGTGAATVDVLADDARAVAPATQPDIVRAIVGKPVQLQPLANDVPGADPTYPDATMQLAAAVRGPGQLAVDSNLDTGTVTVTGTAPGTTFLTYGAQVGNVVGSGRIRVDVLPDPQGDPPPVAVPDVASLKAEQPTLSDVLANDYSPRGDVLVVQKVATDVGWLRASVLQGRFVRVQATGPVTAGGVRDAVVSYTISDGTKTATGQLTVTQKTDDGSQLVPEVVDDQAVVRTGDVVTIPVLDNDTVSGGVPLVLDPEVKVIDGKGEAFASGNLVRFIPDATPVTADTVVTLEYSTHPEGGTTSVTGRVSVTVTPLPTATTPDQAPVARSFSASVTAGDTITVTVPTSGIDPDGDLGYVVGVVGASEGAVDLSLGRVVSTGAATIRYEAYPRSAGTELVRYAIRDRFGKTGDGIIRIGVVQPGDPQPPVAVADDVVAAPGRTVTFDPQANDLIAPDDVVTYEDLAPLNDAGVLKKVSKGADGLFSTKVPAPDDPTVLNYGITDGLFDPSRSTVTIRGQDGYNNAPVAVDDTPQPKAGDTSVTVDVLANDRDPDSVGKLKVVAAVGSGVSVVGGQQVRVPLLDHPQAVPYVISDLDPDDPLQATALIYVPAAASGIPYLTAGKVVTMDANSSVKVDLASYVSDPRGRAVKVTSPDTVSTSPRAYLGQSLTGGAQVTLTSKGDYTGPAALMLQVTDATSDNDPTAVTAYLSIPVQVGPLTPVLRCPSYGVSLVADGPSRTVDIPRLCHAWFPAGLDPATVTYSATWSKQVDRVDLRQSGTGGSQIVLRAQPAAPTGTGSISYGVTGGQQFSLGVQVTQAPPVSVRPISIDGLVAGQSATVEVGRYLDSPLSNPQCALTGVRVLDNAAITATSSGCRITVSASAAARRTATVAFVVSDAPGRSIDGRIAVTIKAPPDVPTGVSALADIVAGGQARVTWSPPAYDGGFPVTSYEVTAVGQKTQTCGASPCTITGLKNGVDVTFTVRARNAVGFSPASAASAPARPDLKPTKVDVGQVTAGDRTLTVSWSPPTPNGGSPVTQYEVHWTNKDGGAGGGVRQVAGAARSTVITGLTNDDRYGITIRARNQLGFGPPGAEVVKQSVGTPATVPAPQVTSRDPGPDDDDASLTVTWKKVDPNGPAITSYTVYRDGKQIAQTSPDQRTVADSVPYDGRTHRYTVTATNGGNKTSPQGKATPFTANGVPQTPRITAASDSGAPNSSASVSWRLGNPHAAAYRTLGWQTDDGRSGSQDCSPSCSSGTFSGLSVSPQHVQIRALTTAGVWSAWSGFSDQYQPYGETLPVTNVSSSQTGSGGHYVITVTWDVPTNGRPETTSTSSNCLRYDNNTCQYTATYEDTRTITITAQSSGSGTSPKSVSYTPPTTPQKPNPTVTPVKDGTCGPGDCPFGNGECAYPDGSACNYIGIEVHEWGPGKTSCKISDSVDPNAFTRTYYAQTGANGTYLLKNSSGQAAYYGYGNRSVIVNCTNPEDGQNYSGSRRFYP